MIAVHRIELGCLAGPLVSPVLGQRMTREKVERPSMIITGQDILIFGFYLGRTDID